MDTGLTLTLLVIVVVIVATVVWLIPRRRADLAEIEAMRQRREAGRSRQVAAIDAEIARLAVRRDQLTGVRQ